MPPERLKIRCYRCNQLLAGLPNKAGAVVACPKCQTELLIPSPDAPPKGDRAGQSAMKSQSANVSQSPAPEVPTFLEEIAAVIPPEVAELRPEDLRVEAEFFESLTRKPTAPASPEPFPFPPSDSPEPVPFPQESSRFAPAGVTTVDPEDVDANPATVTAPPPIPLPKPAVDLPPIEIEPPTLLPPGAEIRRVHEVVLPASVVLAWSLFVLAAIPMSFVAGLLVGHFLWKHIP